MTKTGILRTLSARLIATYVAVVLLALALSGAALLVLGIQYKHEDAYTRMSTSLYFIVPQAREALTRGMGPPQIHARLRRQLDLTSFRLLLLSPDGVLLADSMAPAGDRALDTLQPSQAEPGPGRPFLNGSTVDRTGTTWLYVAVPPGTLLRPDPDGPPGPPGASLRRFFLVLAQPAPTLLEVWDDLKTQLLLGAGLGLLMASLLGWLLARSVTRPLANLSAATREIAAGNYNHKVPVQGSTELASLAELFNSMAAEVERTRRVQHDFLANVSHDLKTPLTSIQGFSQAMLDGSVRDVEGYTAAARVINDEARLMSRLVADLLDLTRILSGEARVEKLMIDPVPLLHQAIAGMQPQAEERPVELKVEVGQLPQILADPDRLRRAVSNLIDNALRHTPSGGTVTLRAEVGPGAMIISVRDTGEGIPAEDLPRIFERFYQVDKSRSSRRWRSGLGLAIVREIVSAHDGQIGVQSQPGVGTEFRISLPLPGPEAARHESHRLGRQKGEPRPTTMP